MIIERLDSDHLMFTSCIFLPGNNFVSLATIFGRNVYAKLVAQDFSNKLLFSKILAISLENRLISDAYHTSITSKILSHIYDGAFWIAVKKYCEKATS